MIHEIRLSSGTLVGLADIDLNTLPGAVTYRIPLLSRETFNKVLRRPHIPMDYYDVKFKRETIHWYKTDIHVLIIEKNQLKHLRGQKWFKEIRPFKRRA